VKNVSKRDLSEIELSVLKCGLNYVIAPDKLPVVDIITATERACSNLSNSESAELRNKVADVLSKNKTPTRSNITREERTALVGLSKDKDILVLPADKGRCTVVMDKTEYKSKCDTMLQDSNTYKKLKRDPTNKFKKEFSECLKEMKDDKTIDWKLHKQLYPTTDSPPKWTSKNT